MGLSKMAVGVSSSTACDEPAVAAGSTLVSPGTSEQPDSAPVMERAVAQSTNRVLGPASLTALGLGGIVGAGIFMTIGVTARDKAGPAVVLSILIAAVACAAVALCFCECAALVPSSGSAYAYGRAAVGRLGGWLAGWNLAGCFLLAGAGVSQAWSGYFQSLLGAVGVAWPARFGGTPVDLDPVSGKFVSTDSILNLPALLALVAVTFVVIRGIRMGLKFNGIILAIKLAVLTVVIFVGLLHTNPAHWTPFAPYGFGGMTLGSVFGGFSAAPAAATGMLAGAATVFFAFGGFEVLSTYSEECRSPRRDVTVGVVSTIAIVTLLYVGVGASVIGLVPFDKISLAAPVSEAFKSAGMPWAQLLVAFGAVAGMSSVLLVVVMSLPRLLMVLGREGLLPPQFFNAIHPKFGTPWKGVLLVGSVCVLLGGFVPLRFIIDAVMMASLAGYVAVCFFTLILRRRVVPFASAFRAPFGALTPLFGALVCLMLMFSLPAVNWFRLAAWWVVGLMAYLAVGKKAGSNMFDLPSVQDRADS